MDVGSIEMVRSVSAIEWKRSHRKDGDLFVHTSIVALDQSSWEKNIPITIIQYLEWTPYLYYEWIVITTRGMIGSE